MTIKAIHECLAQKKSSFQGEKRKKKLHFAVEHLF